MELNITKKEYKDAYDCLMFWPLKKYGRFLHSGQWGDRKIDDYQTWALESLPKSIEMYDRTRGKMKFSTFALWRANNWMNYKYSMCEKYKQSERTFDKLPSVDLFQLEVQVQEHILDLLSEADRKFVELKYGLNGRKIHTWKKMCIIYGKNYNFGLRIRMQKIIKELRKVVNFDTFDI